MSEDRCICCGEIVPEGRMVCPNCEKQKPMKNLSHGEMAQIAEAKKHGFWEYVDDVDYRCSVCHKYAYGCLGEVLSGQYNYCPYCGAKMDFVDY